MKEKIVEDVEWIKEEIVGITATTRQGKRKGRSELKSTFLPSVKTLTKNRTWENLYWEQHPWFLRSKKDSFLSTGSFFRKKVL